MSLPRFMSRAHVDLMNDRLDGNADLAAKCATLTRNYLLGYTISDDPEGITEWALAITPHGLSFSLDSGVETADVLFSGSYTEICESSQAQREGRDVAGDAFTLVRTDEAALAVVTDFLAAAQTVATVPVAFTA